MNDSAQHQPGGQVTAPSHIRWDTLEKMKGARRWLIARPDKVPFYVNGKMRQGPLDGPDDLAQLATYEEAKAALALHPGWRLGFALGPDGTGRFWQGIDLDDVVANKLADLANSLPGYVEKSPSGNGAHAIGYGESFPVLGANGSGIEAYSVGRYFTVTEQAIRDSGPVCLASFVNETLRKRRTSEQPQTTVNDVISLDAKTITTLRSALTHIRADDRQIWIKMGMALHELGKVGRELWLTWSQSSERHRPLEDAKTWDSFKPSNTGYQAVFAEAQRQGWVNPESKAAKLNATVPPQPTSDFQGRTPRNFLSGAVAPVLDPANVPYPIASFAAAFSAAHGFDLSGALMAAIAAAAAMVDDGCVLEAKPSWLISARLWVVLIGKSATGKSPTIKAATGPIKTKHAEVVENFHKTYVRDPDNPTERPPEPALYTSDSTIEALSEKLRDNARGILMITEEFASWIGAIDATTRGDAAKNRGAWLQLYDGGPYQIDRIIRGSFQVPNWGASLLTATTPTALAEHMRNLPEDGLIQRFIAVVLASRDFEADGDATAALKAWASALYWIFENVGPAVVRFSPDARKLFRETEKELGKVAAAMDGITPALASHLGKHSEMVARVALIFHLFESPPNTLELSFSTLQKAVRLFAQLRSHSVLLYTDILGRSPVTDLARALARSIAAADPSLRTIGRDWMTQHCRDFAKAEDRARRAAVQLLEDLDWLKDVSERQYSGWPSKFEVNGKIFVLYAREGEAHRAQRAAVQAVFAQVRSEDEAES